MRRIFILIIIMLLVVLTFELSGVPGVPGIPAASTANQIPANDEVKDILKKVAPSIVKVVSENHKRYIATGIVIDSNYVISSTMVTNHPYETLYIETASGDQYRVNVLGKDQETSLLLLQISDRSLSTLRALRALHPISQAKSPEIGDWVALLGVFYQEFPSIFQGFVSSKSEDRLILNAPVAPGSAGGAVVNKKGELIGVVRGLFDFSFSPDYTYRDQSYEFFIRGNRASNKDLCYAVPISKVTALVKDLQKYGKIMRGWLGVSFASKGKDDSAEIIDIAEDSPAEKAGFIKGDKILAIQNEPVQTGSDVVRMVKTLKPGDNIKIEFIRSNTKKTAHVLISEPKEYFEWHPRVANAMENEDIPPAIPEFENSLPRLENFVVNFSGSRSLGVDVIPLTPELAGKFNIKEGSGLLISKVYPETAAEKSGFQPADIIVRANGKQMKQNVDLRRAINELEDNQAIAIDVYRNGKLKTFQVIPGKNTNPDTGQYQDMLEMFGNRINEIKARMNAEDKIAGREKDLQDRLLHFRLRKDAQIIKYQQQIEQLKKEQELLKKQLENVKKQLELQNKQQTD